MRGVVIGAGIGGLAAAAVLARRGAEVILIDRDRDVGSSLPRFGAAQGSHLHVLLSRGWDVLRDLFPALVADIEQMNSTKIDWALDTHWETRFGAFPRYSSGVQTYSVSRALIESMMFRAVIAMPNVRFLPGRFFGAVRENGRLISARIAGTSTPVTGDVFVISPGFAVGAVISPFIGADEIVSRGEDDRDVAAGRSSFHSLVSETDAIGLSYSSVTVATASLRRESFSQYYYQATPPHDSLGAVICPIEEGRSIATIIRHRTKATTQPQDFVDYMTLAAQVGDGSFARILGAAQPLSPVTRFYKPTMFLRRFDRLSSPPANAVVLGDALCSLNPAFGQGMTTALLQAQVLDDLLCRRRFTARRFYRRATAVLRLPVLLSRLGSGVGHPLLQAYLAKFLERCQESPTAHRRFLGVLHLQRSPLALLDAATMGRALAAWRADRALACARYSKIEPLR